jgi:hypothetical protein
MCIISWCRPRRRFRPAHLFNVGIPYEQLAHSAICSKLAYETPETVEREWVHANSEKGLENPSQYGGVLRGVTTLPRYITSNDDTNQDAQAYVWCWRGNAFVVFRGTTTMQDMLAYVQLQTEEFKGNRALVHRGFLRQFRSIEGDINRELDKELLNIHSIHVIGHSLGGALAQIAAAVYGERFPEKRVHCHTFGAPRVGNVHFVKWFAKHVAEHYRVVNENDPVPMVPLRPVWKHPSNVCMVIDDACNVYLKKKDIPWWRRCFTMIADIDMNNIVQDHACDIYIERIDAIMKARAPF